MSSYELSGIERATAIVNPVSSTSKKGRRRLERLIKSSDFEITTISTSRYPDKTDHIIRNALESSDLLLVVAGDGTFNRVVNILMANHLSDQAKQVPIWSLGGGNAEDGTKANHTKLHLRHPQHVLRDGRIVETHPIKFEVTEPGESEPKLYSAAFYATLGMSALTASETYLNNPNHRRHLGRTALGRLISEPPIAIRGLYNAPVNTVLQDGVERNFYEEIFANSQIMAKYFHFPTHLSKPELYHSVIPEKKHSIVVPAIFKGFLGKLPGEYISLEDSQTFETRHDIYAQFDGETTIIPSSSTVAISLHRQPIHIVVTKPEL